MKKFEVKKVLLAREEQRKANPNFREKSQRFDCKLEYVEEHKSGNHSWAIVEAPDDFPEVSEENLIIVMTIPEHKELKRNNGLCEVYMGHPFIEGTTTLNENINLPRLDQESTNIRKEKGLSVSDLSVKNLRDDSELDPLFQLALSKKAETAARQEAYVRGLQEKMFSKISLQGISRAPIVQETPLPTGAPSATAKATPAKVGG